MLSRNLVLVTGGNRGMGLETHRTFAALGYQISTGCRSPVSGKRTVDRLDFERVVRLNVIFAADIATLGRFIKSAYAQLDVIVNNAVITIDGVGGPASRIRDADIDAIETNRAVNTLGPIRMINAVLPLLENLRDARVVEVSSVKGQLSEMGANFPGYRLSIAALNAATRIYVAALESIVIKVKSVCPEWVLTKMGGDNAEISVQEGVDTNVWLATCDEIPGVGGFYRRRQRVVW